MERLQRSRRLLAARVKQQRFQRLRRYLQLHNGVGGREHALALLENASAGGPPETSSTSFKLEGYRRGPTANRGEKKKTRCIATCFTAGEETQGGPPPPPAPGAATISTTAQAQEAVYELYRPNLAWLKAHFELYKCPPLRNSGSAPLPCVTLAQ
ncbi:ORF3 [torque teno Delphinidae virus 54]